MSSDTLLLGWIKAHTGDDVLSADKNSHHSDLQVTGAFGLLFPSLVDTLMTATAQGKCVAITDSNVAYSSADNPLVVNAKSKRRALASWSKTLSENLVLMENKH